MLRLTVSTRSLRNDSRGVTTQIESVAIALMAVAGLAAVVPFATRAGGRFVEVEDVAVVESATASASAAATAAATASESASESASVSDVDDEGFVSRMGRRVAWGALVFVPLDVDWVRQAATFVATDEEIETVQRFRAPIASTAMMTATLLVPALVTAAIVVAQDPAPVLAKLREDPGAIVHGILMANVEDVVDAKTFLTAKSDDEASQAGERLAASLVAGRILRFGGRAKGQNLGQRAVRVAALDLGNRAQKKAWQAYLDSAVREGLLSHALLDQFRKDGRHVIVASSGGKITGAVHLAEGLDSVRATLIGWARDREAIPLLRETSVRSDALGHEGRVLITPSASTRPVLARAGFVEMFDEVHSDLVLPRESAAALRAGLSAPSVGVGEWPTLREWNLKRIETLMPEMYADLKRVIASVTDGHGQPMKIELVHDARGALIKQDGTIVLDPRMAPNPRLLALAERIGERRFLAEPREGPSMSGSDATRLNRTWFVEDMIDRTAHARGAGIFYELEAGQKLGERLGRYPGSRYAEGYESRYYKYRHDPAEARAELTDYWRLMHRPQVREWITAFGNLWDERAADAAARAASKEHRRSLRIAADEERAAVREVERMLERFSP